MTEAVISGGQDVPTEWFCCPLRDPWQTGLWIMNSGPFAFRYMCKTGNKQFYSCYVSSCEVWKLKLRSAHASLMRHSNRKRLQLFKLYLGQQKYASPEKSIVVWAFSRFVAVTVSLRNKTILLLETLSPFGYDGHTLPHPLPQALPPLVRNHTDHTDREADRWSTVRVAHGQTGEDPDVARPQQAHLSCLTEQVLSLLVGAIRQQDLRVHLRTEKKSASGNSQNAGRKHSRTYNNECKSHICHT